MRPIARQSARLATSIQARQPVITQRTQRSDSRKTFHTQSPRLQDSRTPGSSSDPPPAPFHESREHITKVESEEIQREQGTEQEDVVDPETWNGNNGRIHAAKRLARQKRSYDIPRPPPIPEWFLRHNVKLHQVPSKGAYMNEAVIRCVDNETGHTLFTVPYYSPEHSVALDQRAQETVDQWCRSADEEGKRERYKNIAQAIERWKTDRPENEKNLQQWTEFAKDLASESWRRRVRLNFVSQSISERVTDPLRDIEAFFDTNYGYNFWAQTDMRSESLSSELREDLALPLDSAFDEKMKFIQEYGRRVVNPGDLVLPKWSRGGGEYAQSAMQWSLLEAASSIRAALSLADGSQRASNFAADRVDLSIQCPDLGSHEHLDAMVQRLADIVSADLIRLDINDLAELAEDYVGHGHDEPGSYATMAYDALNDLGGGPGGKGASRVRSSGEHDEEDEMDDEEDAEDENRDNAGGSGFTTLPGFENMGKLLRGLRHQVIGIGVGIPQGGQSVFVPQRSSQAQALPMHSREYRDNQRLSALLDQLLEAPATKRMTDQDGEQKGTYPRAEAGVHLPDRRRKVHGERNLNHREIHWKDWQNPDWWKLDATRAMLYSAETALDMSSKRLPGHVKTVAELVEHGTASLKGSQTGDAPSKIIVHIRDLWDIWNMSSRQGRNIISHLIETVRKRRRSGQQIIIVGTTAQDVLGPFPLSGDGPGAEDMNFRTLNVFPFFNYGSKENLDYRAHSLSLQHDIETSQEPQPDAVGRRISKINLRHVRSMLRRMRPADDLDLRDPGTGKHLRRDSDRFLGNRVLSMGEVQRLVLVAIGLSQSYAAADTVQLAHLALAESIIKRNDMTAQIWPSFKEHRDKLSQAEREGPKSGSKSTARASSASTSNADSNTPDAARANMLNRGIQERIQRIKGKCDRYETQLLSGVVTDSKTAFEDVHAPTETIDSLKTMTTLSLMRPDAFKYGVLAADRLPGLLLYGPPGTGKTLLAKAVAKEAKATVLEVSGAQIYQKYVGEGEKMVRAVFTLAKKLSPCIVFIDEADAIFAQRSGSSNRTTHREIINQFLREWDGMDDHAVFMMVASNRPFDLDDAVLRRLPRRLLVDLPVAKDRESILGIHLKNEALDPSVSLSHLAEQTPFYSGSDLKNLAVAAALACVREENDLAATHAQDETFKLPEKRTLMPHHFDKALTEISASISENMDSLRAIRKFDEQYGDNKGRNKKSVYGFGASDAKVDEALAMVRPRAAASSSSSPSAPPP